MINMDFLMMQLKDVNEKLYKKITLFNTIQYNIFKEEFHKSKKNKIKIIAKLNSTKHVMFYNIEYSTIFDSYRYNVTIHRVKRIYKSFNTFSGTMQYIFIHMLRNKILSFNCFIII